MEINQQPEHSWEEVEKIPDSLPASCPSPSIRGYPVRPVRRLRTAGAECPGRDEKKRAGDPQEGNSPGVYFPNAARLVSPRLPALSATDPAGPFGT